MDKEETTMVTAIPDRVVCQDRKCEEYFHEPCLVVKPDQKGVKNRQESELDGSSDDFESAYEPANIIRRALEDLFSKVGKNVEDSDQAKDLQSCEEAAYSGKKDGSGAVESNSDRKEEKISASEDCLRERNGERKSVKVEKFSKPINKRVEDMTEMIKSMFDPCIEKIEPDGDDSCCSFLDRKIKKKLYEESLKPSCLFHEDTMQKKFREQGVSYSSYMSKDVLKKTIKACDLTAEGLTSEVKDSSEQQKEEKKSACEGWLQVCEARVHPAPRLLSLPQPPALPQCSSWTKSVSSWDYSKVALGGGATIVALFAVYRCFR